MICHLTLAMIKYICLADIYNNLVAENYGFSRLPSGLSARLFTASKGFPLRSLRAREETWPETQVLRT
jgi:hypothetical protein